MDALLSWASTAAPGKAQKKSARSQLCIPGIKDLPPLLDISHHLLPRHHFSTYPVQTKSTLQPSPKQSPLFKMRFVLPLALALLMLTPAKGVVLPETETVPRNLTAHFEDHAIKTSTHKLSKRSFWPLCTVSHPPHPSPLSPFPFSFPKSNPHPTPPRQPTHPPPARRRDRHRHHREVGRRAPLLRATKPLVTRQILLSPRLLLQAENGADMEGFHGRRH